MGVQEPDSEKVIRGSKEGFTDSIKTNTALIRKRVRSTRVKVEEVQEGCVRTRQLTWCIWQI